MLWNIYRTNWQLYIILSVFIIKAATKNYKKKHTFVKGKKLVI